MEYNHRDIEARWQKYWRDNNTYRVDIDTKRPKYYVLDMFPYPSGAGLHVGHPLGYIASDIVSRAWSRGCTRRRGPRGRPRTSSAPSST